MVKTYGHEIEFSSLFFDTLFGLILFFGLDSFLEIKDPVHFLFYLSVSGIVVYWWLTYKAIDDIFGNEVSDSVTDMIIGLCQIGILNFMLLTSKTFDYVTVTYLLAILFMTDLVWAILWKYAGKWKTKSRIRREKMELYLSRHIRLDAAMVVVSVLLAVSSFYINTAVFVAAFIVLNAGEMYTAAKLKFMSIDIF